MKALHELEGRLMFEIIALAIALSMDAFAVSIGIGMKLEENTLQGFKSSLLFGMFQGGMTLIGFYAGSSILTLIESYFHIISFILLIFIGSKMIYEGLGEDSEGIQKLSNRVLLTLAIATSIDALAAGFTLTTSSLSIFISFLIIGVITLVLSLVGNYIGKLGATWFEGKAEILGGVCLIALGLKTLLN